MKQNETNWESFFRDDTSNMLEDALPYLPSQFKKLAALYIKSMELDHIMKGFDNSETLSACGLGGNNTSSPEALLSALKLRAPKQTANRIESILQLLKMIQIMPMFTSQNQSPNQTDLMNQLKEILEK